MVDLSALERQLGDESLRIVGPARRVDDRALYESIVAARPRTLRHPSTFGAMKSVVAGLIVVLFGGVLLAGVLTPPNDEQLPTVGASASAQAEPTEVSTIAPLPTAEAEADM